MDDWLETSEGFNRYLITRGRTRDTATTYCAHLRPYFWWMGRRGVPLEDASRSDVEAFLALQLASVSASTAHVRLSAIKAFYRWKLDLKDREEPPQANGLTVRKEQHQPRPPISLDSEARLLAACTCEEERLMIDVAVACGLRISELVGIKGDDLYMEEGLILIRGKGRKERWVCPGKPLMKRLTAYSQSKGPVFEMNRRQARRVLMRIAKNAEVKGFYSHRLRITFASRFLEQTHDLDSLRVLMGHASADVTARYAAFDAQQRALDQMRRLVG